MYCPGLSKDWEMPPGDTWGMEVEPCCPKCGPLGSVRLADWRVHPIPNSLEQHGHVSLAHRDIDGMHPTSPGIGVLHWQTWVM